MALLRMSSGFSAVSFQLTWYYPCSSPYWDKVFSLDVCAADQFYITTLKWTREMFPVKQITHLTIACCVKESQKFVCK